MGLSNDAAGYLLAKDGRAVVGGAGPGGAASSRGAAAGGAGPSRRDVASAAIGGSHELEVRFLAGCVAQPAIGREVLAGVDEGFFVGVETRAAFRCVMLRLGLETAGNTLQRGQIIDAPGDGEVFAEVIVRSGRERFSAAVVRELFLRLQEAQVSRLIARLKLMGEAEMDGEQGGELARLYEVRHRLRDAIRATPVDDDEPDEG